MIAHHSDTHYKHALWDLHYMCNYRCEYCFYDLHWDYLESITTKLPPEAIAEAWHDSGYQWHISISGGEPFVYKGFVKLIGLLTPIHLVNITSNLSLPLDDFVKNIDPSLIPSFVGSYHPTQFRRGGHALFMRNIELLKEAGFHVSV